MDQDWKMVLCGRTGWSTSSTCESLRSVAEKRLYMDKVFFVLLPRSRSNQRVSFVEMKSEVTNNVVN